MMEFFLDYGLFFAKTITLVIMFVLVIGFISSLAARGQHANRLQIKNVTQRYEKTKEHVQREVLSKKAFKKIQKSQKKAAKKLLKAENKVMKSAAKNAKKAAKKAAKAAKESAKAK